MEKVLFTQLTIGELKAIIKEAVGEIFVNQNQQTVNEENEDIFLNLGDACKLLQIAKPTLYTYTSKNIIPHIKKGKKLFFIKADLLEWLKAGKRMNLSELAKRENFFSYMRKH